eukprot:TRINITY_DN32201_c0_g1_i1.p1 TRINITY_DN32201_c0_g1~~TRINITY_DN32201_c0_g1_i1.p1  ORF type:complete len:360 (+),score=133.39 TRINITY_DN32201_c0_g1_i1:84-1163(+)
MAQAAEEALPGAGLTVESIDACLTRFAEYDMDAAAAETVARRHEDPVLTEEDKKRVMYGPEMVESILDSVIPMSGAEPKFDYALAPYCPEEEGGIPFRDPPPEAAPAPGASCEGELAKQVDLNAQLVQHVSNLTTMVREIEDAIEIRKLRGDFLEDGKGTFRGLLTHMMTQRRENEDKRRGSRRVTRRRFEKSTQEIDEETLETRRDIMRLRKQINDVEKHLVAEDSAEELLRAELVRRSIPFVVPDAVAPTYSDLCLAQRSSPFTAPVDDPNIAYPSRPRAADPSTASTYSRLYGHPGRQGKGKGKVTRIRDPVPSDYKPVTPDAPAEGSPEGLGDERPLPDLPSPPYAACSPHAPAE